MVSAIPKVILPALGRPLIKYLLDRSSMPRFSQVLAVISPDHRESVRQTAGANVGLVVQEEPRGTADAFRCALSHISPEVDNVLVVYSDMPLLEEATLDGLMAFTEIHGSPLVLMTSETSQPSGFGRVMRDAKKEPVRIIEERDCTSEQRALTEINLGIYAFHRNSAGAILDRIDRRNVQDEYYLTDCLVVARALGVHPDVYRVPWSDEFKNVNNPTEYAQVLNILRYRKNSALLEQGVKMIDPASTYVDWECSVKPDCWLYPGTVVEGRSVIGAGSLIGPFTRIVDSQIGRGCRIEFSVVEHSVIDDHVQVGPYSHLRPESHLHDHVRIGNFVEIKKSAVGEKTKVLHLSYLGDAMVGKNTNIGAGTITCNYDGVQKNRTTIGDRVFIGSNNSLVAPLCIGDGSYTAAGSTITRDIPPGALGIGRVRQKNKEGWADRVKHAGDEAK